MIRAEFLEDFSDVGTWLESHSMHGQDNWMCV